MQRWSPYEGCQVGMIAPFAVHPNGNFLNNAGFGRPKRPIVFPNAPNDRQNACWSALTGDFYRRKWRWSTPTPVLTVKIGVGEENQEF
jgi:hypothetical protein